MKLKYTLAVGALALATVTQAQPWIADTADMTNGYAKNVYYSLENGSVKSEDANNWDIAIKYGVMTASVVANHAGKTVMVYPLTGLSAATKFGTDLTDDTAGITGAALYNSIQTWDAGAFNMDADGSNMFDYGWGEYDMDSHWVTGDKIYLVKTATGIFQVWIEAAKTFNSSSHPVASPPTWVFHVANLDGTNRKDKELEMKPTYENKLFAYYNLNTDAFVNRDPDNNAWDFVLTQYYDEVAPGMMYKVTGILSNQNRGVARITGAGAATATWSTAVEADLDSTVNIIGRDWKKSLVNNTDLLYPIKDTMTYFMKVPNGDVWQFELTYASVGNTASDPTVLPGRVGLRKRKVYTPPITSVKDVNAFVGNVLVVPNPSVNGSAYLLVDAKQDIKQAQVTITDISGRAIMKADKAIKAGFQQIGLDVSKYPTGIYMINLSGAGFNTTQKLVVQ